MNFATCFPSKGLSSSKRDDYLHLHIIYHQINQNLVSFCLARGTFGHPAFCLRWSKTNRSSTGFLLQTALWDDAWSKHVQRSDAWTGTWLLQDVWCFFFPYIVKVEGLFEVFFFFTFLNPGNVGIILNMADVLFFLFFFSVYVILSKGCLP